MATTRKLLLCVLVALLGIVACAAMAWAQDEDPPVVYYPETPAESVAYAVANSGIFPTGTGVVSITIDGASAVVDLSAEAVTADLGDALADEMVEAITDALNPWPEITSIEVTVSGTPLWQYLPAANIPSTPADETSVQSVGASIMSTESAAPMSVAPAAMLTSELSGKKIALHPSHGSYWHARPDLYRWMRAMRTMCGPNPTTRPPGWEGSVYQGSNYYYNTRRFRWGSFYEDDMSPETIRFLKTYLEASGASVWASRDLDKNSGDFPLANYPQYPNCSFPLPKWQVAAKYYLQERGDVPEWVWNEPALFYDSDKDIRARPYYANYLGCDLSFSLHSNATGVDAYGTGTEAYWYTSMYPWLQQDSIRFAGNMCNGVVNAINGYFDDTYAKVMYPYTGTNPREWARSYAYPGYTSWVNRGVKTSNFGEIREAQMPATLVEVAFHDAWKWFPDNLFLQDQIWRATAAWGFYEGICDYFSVTPKPSKDAEVVSVSFPAVVGPNASIAGTVTVKNLGMSWCWGDKWENMLYFPYTVWNLAATADDQFVPGTKIAVAQGATVNPGDTYTFDISLTAPATTALLNTSWQMIRDDAKGGAFGAVASAQIQVDADAPVISIASPTAGDYGRAGSVAIQFGATDALSGVASISATLDGAPVESGASFGLLWAGFGPHTLSVTAVDGVGNTATQTVTFNVIATIESMIAAVNELYAAGQIDNEGIQTSLLAKLAKYEKDTGDIPNAKNYLNNFINEVEAQSGQHMTVAAANLLLEDAAYCIAHLPVQ